MVVGTSNDIYLIVIIIEGKKQQVAFLLIPESIKGELLEKINTKVSFCNMTKLKKTNNIQYTNNDKNYVFKKIVKKNVGKAIK